MQLNKRIVYMMVMTGLLISSSAEMKAIKTSLIEKQPITVKNGIMAVSSSGLMPMCLEANSFITNVFNSMYSCSSLYKRDMILFNQSIPFQQVNDAGLHQCDLFTAGFAYQIGIFQTDSSDPVNDEFRFDGNGHVG